MKGISIVERHFEKAIALVVALAVAGYVGWDFYAPATFQLGSNSNVIPANANEILLQETGKISQKQASTEIIEWEPLVKGATQQAFAQKMNGDLLPAAPFPRTAPNLAAKMIVPDTRSVDTLYYQPRFEPPTMVTPVEWFSDALQPNAVSANEPLKKFLASQSDADSLDVIWTRPVARVDLKAIRNELTKEDKEANPPLFAANSEWRKNAIFLLDVVFERQEQNENGSWSDPVIVPIMFGFEGNLFRDKKDLDSNKIFASMRGEKSIEKLIRQPDFYDTLHGIGKTNSTKGAAGEQAAAPGDKKKQQARDKKKQELDNYMVQMQALDKELNSFGGDWTQEKEDTKKVKAKQDADRVNKEGKKNNPNYKLVPPEDLKIPLWKRITKEAVALRKVIKDLQKEFGVESEQSADSKDSKVEAPSKPAQSEADFIDVWTHDLQAPLGKVVRYRCRIDIYNPFFGKERQLGKKQQGLAKASAISTDFSQWSAPVRVPRKTMYFAENGTLETSVAGSKSSIFFNVYVLQNGLWRKTEPNPSFELGQPLIFPLTFKDKLADNNASVNEIDTGWYVVDIVDDPNASPEKNRSTLPSVVLSHRDGKAKFEIRYPTAQVKDLDQAKLKELVEQAKSIKVDPVKAG